MINDYSYINTRDILRTLYERQGGNLFYNKVDGSALTTDVINWHSAVKIPSDYKEFAISIYNTKSDTEIARLSLFVSPNELVIGQQQVFGNSYTRRGWVNTAWGNNQTTLSAQGVSAGFYYYNLGRGGLTNAHRKQSPSFVNLMDIVGLYRNNGWYFLNGITNPDLFQSGNSRVINVMDSIKIEYDDTTYIGSFNSFTLNDAVDSPYKMSYSFEFVVSSFGTYLQDIDGHLAWEENYIDQEVHIGLQGSDINFKKVIGMDVVELNDYFKVDPTTDPRLYTYSDRETINEVNYYESNPEDVNLIKIPEGVFRVTRGWLDRESHNKKCDFRTHTGRVYSATDGKVVNIKKSYSYGGSNYVLVKSDLIGTDGKKCEIYVRYYHMDPGTITVNIGDDVLLGTVLGEQGTDGGRYPEHCDFAVNIIKDGNYNYNQTQRVECTPVLNYMWNVLSERAKTDPDLALDFTTLVCKHGKLREL